MSLLKKLKKNTTLADAAVITESEIHDKLKDSISIQIPVLNLAMSGRFDKGIMPGVTTIAGKSKHFKSKLGMVLAQTYISHYKDSAMLFYDNEFGTPDSYIDDFGEDKERILHSPITSFEELKFDIMKQLDGVERGDHLFVFVDSLGNLASKKEVDDAREQKSVADMTRGKAGKSLFRMITPHLTLKKIPFVAIQHTYQTQEMYSKEVVSGGTGGYLASDTIWVMGRQQNKDQKSKQILGYDFIINIEKSRYVKEGMKIPVSVTWDQGINKWSGLFELALAFDFIRSEKQGWYQTEMYSGASLRKKDLEDNDEYWNQMLQNNDFCNTIESHFQGKSDKHKDLDIEEIIESIEE